MWKDGKRLRHPRTRWIEFLLLFGLLPVGMLLLKQRLLIFAALWLLATLAAIYLQRQQLKIWNPAGFRAGVRPVLLRFALLAPLILGATYLFMPESFLNFPRERPQLWLMVMALYPLLSVWPQEMLYRAFLHRRYAPLFGQGKGFITTSALSFGFAHVLFLNPIAILMSAVGGLLFARDYAKHQSLALAMFEHALYGCLIFTAGLGKFFFTQAAWAS